jgi:hypothetical protein
MTSSVASVEDLTSMGYKRIYECLAELLGVDADLLLQHFKRVLKWTNKELYACVIKLSLDTLHEQGLNKWSLIDTTERDEATLRDCLNGYLPAEIQWDDIEGVVEDEKVDGDASSDPSSSSESQERPPKKSSAQAPQDSEPPKWFLDFAERNDQKFQRWGDETRALVRRAVQKQSSDGPVSYDQGIELTRDEWYKFLKNESRTKFFANLANVNLEGTKGRRKALAKVFVKTKVHKHPREDQIVLKPKRPVRRKGSAKRTTTKERLRRQVVSDERYGFSSTSGSCEESEDSSSESSASLPDVVSTTEARRTPSGRKAKRKTVSFDKALRKDRRGKTEEMKGADANWRQAGLRLDSAQGRASTGSSQAPFRGSRRQVSDSGEHDDAIMVRRVLPKTELESRRKGFRKEGTDWDPDMYDIPPNTLLKRSMHAFNSRKLLQTSYCEDVEERIRRTVLPKVAGERDKKEVRFYAAIMQSIMEGKFLDAADIAAARITAIEKANTFVEKGQAADWKQAWTMASYFNRRVTGDPDLDHQARSLKSMKREVAASKLIVKNLNLAAQAKKNKKKKKKKKKKKRERAANQARAAPVQAAVPRPPAVAPAQQSSSSSSSSDDERSSEDSEE